MLTACNACPLPAIPNNNNQQRTLLFFQLEMQGGIFQSCWSFTVSGRGGECMTGTGGEPAPRGTCRARTKEAEHTDGQASRWGK